MLIYQTKEGGGVYPGSTPYGYTAEFLSLGTVDLWAPQCCVVGAVLGTAGCVTAPLAPEAPRSGCGNQHAFRNC